MLEENWSWIQEYWNEQSEKYSLSEWRFGKNRRKTSLALTNYTKKTVTISQYFLESCTQKQMKNTVLHEIAHILAGHASAHGPRWKKIAREIGCDAEVCGQMNQPPGKYTLYCPQGCFKRQYYRRPQLTGKVCKECRKSPILHENK